MSINLNGNWKLGICDDSVFTQINKEFTTYAEIIDTQITQISGTVPGNLEIDMQTAGLLDDPFFGKNPLIVQDLEQYHMFYSKEFTLEDCAYEREIVFEGIDTFADIYINGKFVASTDNMLISHTISGANLKSGINEIFVHIHPTTIKAREIEYQFSNFMQKYNYDMTHVRKANYMGGWDIFQRMVSSGIWRDVHIEEVKPLSLVQTYLFTNSIAENHAYADIDLFFDIDFGRFPYKDSLVECTLERNGEVQTFSERAWGKIGYIKHKIKFPALWWPKGQGEAALYNATVKLYHKGECVDTKEFKFGVRTVKLDRTSVTDENGNGEFCFIVNGRKIFVLGTNWVPLDSLPSRSKEKLEAALDLVDEIGCNMIRCWGGGYYEDPAFFEYCDAKGIMVWQDFMLGCGIYPQNNEFLAKLSTEIIHVVKKFRQYASLCLWAGDNECDCATDWAGGFINPNDNVITRKLMPSLILQHDYVRDFLPSSPYMDEKACEVGKELITEEHLWGPRDYFKSDYYRYALAHFASETGYHGCNSINSLKKFISEDALWPCIDNEEWLLHSSSPVLENSPTVYRIPLMSNQIKVLFGYIPDNLEEFVQLSQISQAEAKKYFIERFRIGKWRRTGIIWWNILDGCPQISDAVVDYYMEKKLAFDYIKTSQQPICLMVDEPNEKNKLPVVAANDTPEEVEITYFVMNMQTEQILASGTSKLPANEAIRLAEVDLGQNGEFLLLEWSSKNYSGNNHYVMGSAPYDSKSYLKQANKLSYYSKK